MVHDVGGLALGAGGGGARQGDVVFGVAEGVRGAGLAALIDALPDHGALKVLVGEAVRALDGDFLCGVLFPHEHVAAGTGGAIGQNKGHEKIIKVKKTK
jgi:hypothetical protein